MAGLIGDRFIKVCIDDTGNAIPGSCRFVVEGPMIDPSLLDPEDAELLSDPDTLVRVNNKDDLSTLFGVGSVLYEGLTTAISCCKSNQIEIYALPRLNSGVSTVINVTVTVPVTGTTQEGNIDIYWGDGQYAITVPVYVGMTAAQIATSIVESVPDEFFFTASSAGGVVTLTAKNGGNYGNQLYASVNWRGNDLPEGVGVAITQLTPGSGAYPRYDDYAEIMGNSCCACCLVHLSDSPQWQDGALDYIQSTWECDRPNCMTMGYTYATGSPEQVIPRGNNYTHVEVVSHCNISQADPNEGDPIFPWMMAAGLGAKSCCNLISNPELSIEGPEYGLIDCLSAPATCNSCYDYDDRQELNDEGFATVAFASSGDGYLASPYIEADISNGVRDSRGAKSRTWRSMNQSRLARRTATLIANELSQYQGVALFTNTTAVRPGTKGVSVRIIQGKMKAWFMNNVGVLFSAPYNLDEQVTIQRESDLLPECYGDPSKLIATFIYEPPLRIESIGVSLRPVFDPQCSNY